MGAYCKLFIIPLSLSLPLFQSEGSGRKRVFSWSLDHVPTFFLLEMGIMRGGRASMAYSELHICTFYLVIKEDKR